MDTVEGVLVVMTMGGMAEVMVLMGRMDHIIIRVEARALEKTSLTTHSPPGHWPLALKEQLTSIVRVALFKFRVPITVAAVEASSSMGPDQRQAATKDKAMEAAAADGESVMAMACQV